MFISTLLCLYLLDFQKGLNEVIAEGAKLEAVASGLKDVMAPVWTSDGKIHFLNSGDLMVMPEGSAPTVEWKLEKGPSVLAVGPGNTLFGGNALGEVFMIDREGKARTVASSVQGKRIPPISGMAYRSDGSIYFSVRASAEQGDPARLGLYGILPNAGGAGGEAAVPPAKLLVDKGLPRGVALSIDEKTLYFSDPEYNRVVSYELDKRGVPSNPRVVGMYRPKKEGPLGDLRSDSKGNVYCANGDGVAVLSPDGEFIGLIATPEPATGLSWGRADGKWLFITTKTALYRLQTKIGWKRT